jgi:Predicted translation initiation factor 2B subunit, eIF-2B alpha/beta/delta family
MKLNGQSHRPIWFDTKDQTVKIIDQRALPHKFIVEHLKM